MSENSELSRLKIENEQLQQDNAAMRSDLHFAHIRLESVKSHLWDRSNELAEVQSQMCWYQEKVKILERTVFDKNKQIQG